jgi:hypothetical protein
MSTFTWGTGVRFEPVPRARSRGDQLQIFAHHHTGYKEKVDSAGAPYEF